MTGAELLTTRLLLRPVQAGDAEAIADGLGRWEVTQWLALPPWPYHLDHALDFVASDAARAAFAITLRADGPAAKLRGVIAITPAGSLGYWLNPEVKGQGLMREAAAAVTGAHFAGSDQALIATVQLENDASARILHWLGFQETGRKREHSRIRGEMVDIISLQLTAAAWRASPAAAALTSAAGADLGAAASTLPTLAQREAALPPAAGPLEDN